MILTQAQLATRIDAILEADIFGADTWSSASGPTQTFTYTFRPDHTADYVWSDDSPTFSAFTAAQKLALRAGLDELSHYINVDFVENTDLTAASDLNFFRADDLDPYTVDDGHQGRGAGSASSSTNWRGAAAFRTDVAIEDAENFDLILHNLGHAMGLKHATSEDSDESFGPYLPTAEDSDRFSIMSLNLNPVTSAEARHFMQYDVAALQQYWGSRATTHAGDTVHTTPTDGQAHVIWDSSGTDMLRWTGTAGATLDLRQGAFSSLGSTENISIAYGTVIENATGGAGNDSIRGNDAANVLRGNAGNDTIIAAGGNDLTNAGDGDDRVEGGAGNDTFIGNAGRDRYWGGEGFDIVDYSDSPHGVELGSSYSTSRPDNWGRFDRLREIERVIGSDTGGDKIEMSQNGQHFDEAFTGGGNDTVSTAVGDQLVRLGDGNDQLNASSGVDTYYGGDGSDWFVIGGLQDITMDMSTGVLTVGTDSRTRAYEFEKIHTGFSTGSNDAITGTSGDNIVRTFRGDDRVWDGLGDDLVALGNDNDYVRVGGGRDTYEGGTGTDYISYYDSPNGVTLNLETDFAARGWAANDSIKDFESASGSGTGGDIITGSEGANKIQTYGGDDLVFDLGGDDIIRLGDGNDTVVSGGGSDSYVGGDGTDFVSYLGSAEGVYMDLGNNTVWGGRAADDTIHGFEGADGSQTGGDTITGTAGDNLLRTHGGNDRVFDKRGDDTVLLGDGDDYVRAGGGRDSYDGGAGNDTISYFDSTGGVKLKLGEDYAERSSASNDTIKSFENAGGSRIGDDSIWGSAGDNTIHTNGGDDRVWDGKGDDVITLGDGNDYVRVGGGKDSYDGDGGRDYISYYDSSGGVTLDLAADSATGSWANNDTIKNFESASGSGRGADDLRGTGGANDLRGYGGDDSIWGRSGDDTLRGGDGADRFDGGHGDDLLIGGDDADVFHFDRGEDHDTITDFEDDIDLIELDNFTFDPGQDAFDFAAQAGDDVVFDFGDGDMLTVENITIAQLQDDLNIV